MGSARIGTGIANVIAAWERAESYAARQVKRAYINATTTSGLVTVTFPSQLILDAFATATAAGTALPVTVASIAAITATTVKVVAVDISSASAALSGTKAVTVAADFY